jgi:hypothetical protein
MSLVDLNTRTFWPPGWEINFELALEYIEATAGKAFSAPQIAREIGVGSAYKGVQDAIASLLSLGWLTRLSPKGARPVYYVITPGYEPQAGAA